MKTRQKNENITSEVPEEETEEYLTYTNNGTINVTVSGNNNVITFMAGQPPAPSKPPGGNG